MKITSWLHKGWDSAVAALFSEGLPLPEVKHHSEYRSSNTLSQKGKRRRARQRNS